MTRAMILAAGRGTRLHPLTEELPKPLVPVGDRPMIAHIAGRLANAGLARAVINVFHHADAFTPDVLAKLPLALEVVRESTLLGTAGGVANARAALGEGEIVVWNGDILADVDIAALLAAHAEAGDAEATMAYAPRAAGEGTLGLGRHGEVVRLRGERFGEEVTGGDFLGVHVLGAMFRSGLPIPGCLVADGYLPALRRGARVASFAVLGAWDDVGNAAAYVAANARWLAQRDLTSFVAATACVGADIEVRGSVVGEGATVTGSGELGGCVVWPGAHAVAPLRDAVVTLKNLVRF
jgi:mannose-1-phosphate guanylyltransferase